MINKYGKKGGWIIDLGIRKFFDTIQWKYIRDVIKHGVRDVVIIRQIDKWSKKIRFTKAI